MTARDMAYAAWWNPTPQPLELAYIATHGDGPITLKALIAFAEKCRAGSPPRPTARDAGPQENESNGPTTTARRNGQQGRRLRNAYHVRTGESI